jgi:hypothetical protein
MSTVKEGKPQQPYRLIVNKEKSWMDVLTIQFATGREALPVFSDEEEAEEFVRLGNWGAGWQVREASARELVSVLSGPGADIGWVALDPWPEIHVGMVIDLISVDRRDFVEQLVGRIQASCSTARDDAAGHESRPALVAYPVVDDGAAARSQCIRERRDSKKRQEALEAGQQRSR